MVHWTCVTQCQSTLLLKREKKLRKMVCGVGRRKKEQSHAQSSDQPFSPLPVFDSYRAGAGAWQQQFNSSCHSLFFLFCCPHRLFLKSCCCISKFSQQSTSMSVSRASCCFPPPILRSIKSPLSIFCLEMSVRHFRRSSSSSTDWHSNVNWAPIEDPTKETVALFPLSSTIWAFPPLFSSSSFVSQTSSVETKRVTYNWEGKRRQQRRRRWL